MTESKSTVLVVEDEKQMRKLVTISLRANEYEVIEAETAEEGVKQAAAYTPDLVLLDLGLPVDGSARGGTSQTRNMDGFSVIKRIREWSTMPIIVISASGQEEKKVRALDEGADDYLTKPFGVDELMARIRVALRHNARGPDASAVVRIGDEIQVDLAARLVQVRGEEVHLTPIEYKLLTVLAKHAGMVITHRHLLEQVWGPGHAHQMQYLRVYMTQLRHKLEQNPAHPRYLLTEPGVGYRLKIE
jgi:two-component system KDP operon response regulator KdpE